MRAEGERHPRPHAVQTESSFGASAKHGAQGTAGESGEDRPAYRIDPGAQIETGLHDRMLSKLKAYLERLQITVRKGRLVNPEKIDRRIGSILARHPGMSSWVCVRREELPAATVETASGNKKRAAKPRQVVH